MASVEQAIAEANAPESAPVAPGSMPLEDNPAFQALVSTVQQILLGNWVPTDNTNPVETSVETSSNERTHGSRQD